MLTRLKVTGFKNLVETEVRFGPFTCVAGFNGVGKSNLFDAIRFLAALADHPFSKAATMVRGGADFADLFTRGGDGRMTFECDMIVPREGVDDFHQRTEASHTFLTYRVELALDTESTGRPRIRLDDESLVSVPKREAARRLGFVHTRSWRDSVIHTSQRRAPFIRTESEHGQRIVRLSSDKMSGDPDSRRGGGRPSKFLAAATPRTVLSAAQNADEARTAVLVRAEMRTWTQLQLEPSALREPDELHAPTTMDPRGRHLAATLWRLATEADDSARVYAGVANQLARLVDDVRALQVVRDDVRRTLQLTMRDRRGIELPASSLSDGTLRFIALSVLDHDPTVTGLLCLEEPENGIHPERMDAMMTLLQDLATDPEEPVDADNPLRQLIISTHSPIVAARVDKRDLVFADHRDAGPRAPIGARSVALRPVAGTWRDTGGVSPVSRGDVVRYLSAIRPVVDDGASTTWAEVAPDLEQLNLFGAPE